MHRIKEVLMNELMEFGDKMAKNPNAKPSVQEIERVHKLSDIIKNLDKIEMLEEGGYSEDGHYMGEGRIYGTSYDGGSSYARGRMRAKRDSMGRYSRDSGYRDMGGSYRGGYSRDGGDMMERLEEMMHEATDPKEREAIKRCMKELDD